MYQKIYDSVSKITYIFDTQKEQREKYSLPEDVAEKRANVAKYRLASPSKGLQKILKHFR